MRRGWLLVVALLALVLLVPVTSVPACAHDGPVMVAVLDVLAIPAANLPALASFEALPALNYTLLVNETAHPATALSVNGDDGARMCGGDDARDAKEPRARDVQRERGRG